MKKKVLVVYVLTALAGVGLHFLYRACPTPFVGLFAPVGESVWEHLKLLYWPFFLASAVLARGMEGRLRAWSGFLTALLVQPVALTAVYYLLRAGWGVSGLALDIFLYLAVLAGGFLLAFAVYRRGRAEPALGLLIVLSAIYGVSLMAFTLAAPQLPIFLAP